MRVLVTGATGFIGRALVRQLLLDGHSVTGFARHPRPAGCELRCGSVLDPAALNEAVAGHDAVCHLAALALVRESFTDPVRYFRVNVGGTLNVLDAMTAEVRRRAQPLRMVFASTGSVYGIPDRQPIGEDQPPAPMTPYAATKAAAEAAIGYQAALGTLGAVTLRTFNVAGAADGYGDPDATRVIPATLRAAAGHSPQLNVNGDGSAVREYIHVCDLARAYSAALSIPEPAGHRIYNAGSGAGVSVREVIKTTEQVTGRMVPVRWGPPVSEPPELRADISRITAELGWQPTQSSLETIITDAWQALTATG